MFHVQRCHLQIADALSSLLHPPTATVPCRDFGYFCLIPVNVEFSLPINVNSLGSRTGDLHPLHA